MSETAAGSLSIRACGLEDIQSVLELWRQADATPGVTDTAADLRRAVAESPAHVLVAEVGGHRVGSVIGTFDGWRGNGGKPHWAEFCYRPGGETVYVCSEHPNGVTEAQYQGILAGSPKAKGWGWRTMRRNPGVYVRGRVRHADHTTIILHGWHRVVMNTEGQSRAMRNVAFLD